jgi:two-component system LytT family sensor kinase
MFKQINAKLKNDTARIEFWVVIGFILISLLFHVFDIIHASSLETANPLTANGVQTPVTYTSDPVTALFFNHLIILVSYLLLVFYVTPAFENGQEKASNTLFVFAFIAICFVLGIINMYFSALLALKIMVIYFNRNRQNKESGLYYEAALLTACWILIVMPCTISLSPCWCTCMLYMVYYPAYGPKGLGS